MGYIYIRWHRSYKDLVKLGKTLCPVERNQVYITGEPNRGYYLLILKVVDEDFCEKLLEDKLKEFHYTGTGGTEFYDREIINNIIPILNEFTISFEECNLEEINRRIRMKQIMNEIKNESLKNKYHRKMKELEIQRLAPKMRDYQITDNILDWFNSNDKGIINWC